MPTTPPQIDPEHPRTEIQRPDQPATHVSDTPVSVVPHDADGRAVEAPVRIRTNRYGELDEHELVKLLDTIEDERARGRFRESIYISLFVWLAIAWVAFYGPKYLWHSPQLISPTEALQKQEMVRLNAPVMPHHSSPAPPPKVDRGTLERLRALEPKRAAARETPKEPTPPSMTQPLPSNPAPELPKPALPQPVSPRASAPVPDAPAPQPATKPNFSTPGTASEDMQQAMQGSKNAGSGGGVGIRGNGRGAQVGQGVDILSDTQGVNFQPYLGRIMRMIYEQWIPLIPEEARPPLNKHGVTQIRFTINPDGTIAFMHLDGSTHDDALNRAAWSSIPAVGQFPPLPKEFHGPNLELRVHFLVNQQTE